MKKLINNNGITIIALIVTIVILLILAGISISTLTGDSGIIVNATKAKFISEVRDIEEQLELTEIKDNDGEDFKFGTLEDLIERTDEYNEILSIENKNLVYDPNKVSQKQAQWLESINIYAEQNMIPIYTAEHLQKIGSGEEINIEEAGNKTYNFSLDGYYILQNNINLNGNEENQWTPIAEFQGILNGDGYKISGLYINGADKNNQGLFASNQGTIENIIMTNGYMNIREGAAAIVSDNKTGGIIRNCVNEIEIYSIHNHVGGIVGYNQGIIEYCTNNAYLELQGISGGICGVNYSGGIIRNCKNIHNIIFRDFYLGGIVGQNDNGGLVVQCLNTGEILKKEGMLSRSSKGGICGSNNGDLKYCYNANIISLGGWSVGGIAGYNGTTGNIESCYNVGKISIVENTGGIAGDNSGNINNSYTISENTVTGNNTGTINNSLKKTNDEMLTNDFITVLNLGDAEEIFILDSKNINKGYPILKWQQNT